MSAGAVFILLTAVFCYHMVRDTIVENEKESIESIAKVSADSLLKSLEAKRNLIYAALSGDMDGEEAVRQNMLKTGEKSRYIRVGEEDTLKEWEQRRCEHARTNPGEVAAGPIIPQEDGHYAFYMTKAIYMMGSIAGYVQVELNLDEVFEEEQALSGLRFGHQGYCVVKDADGITIMGDADKKEEELEVPLEVTEGSQLSWSYVVDSGTPKRTRKLIGYHTAEFGGQKFILCAAENYDGVVEPVEKTALYLSVLGIILIIWVGSFVYKILQQQKEEEQLMRELEYEKELNEANEALKNQESLMQKYNHSKTASVLTGAIAHEFNNLMTPVVLYSEIFLENDAVMSELPEETKELAASVKRCGELAGQLLDYSRQGRAEKVLAKYNATFAVSSSIHMIERLLPESIHLETAVCEVKYYIKGQVGALNQILLNLVTNAVHAIGQREGVITIQFGLSREDGRMVRLTVKDNGEGIPEEIRQRIFEPFFTTKGEKSGTGIGLTVVKRLVEEHGGTIKVKSRNGEGTLFIMDFPVTDE